MGDVYARVLEDAEREVFTRAILEAHGNQAFSFDRLAARWRDAVLHIGRPARWGGLGWIGGGLATAATVSIVATLVTAPLVAWTFGRIALLGPVTNLALALLVAGLTMLIGVWTMAHSSVDWSDTVAIPPRKPRA